MANLEKICKEIRRDIINASYLANACHIGSALSCVEILVNLYWKTLKKNDVFIFSKASGASALYAVLAKKGYFKKEKLTHYLKNYPLASTEVPGVVHSVGSLGHGLPVAVGMALANRKRNVYVLLGDADVQEGTFYESLLFARKHLLKNLYILIDRNGLQACGHTEDILGIELALAQLKVIFPFAVLYTVKGWGVDFMEHDYTWHYKNLDKETYEKALLQLS